MHVVKQIKETLVGKKLLLYVKDAIDEKNRFKKKYDSQ